MYPNQSGSSYSNPNQQGASNNPTQQAAQSQPAGGRHDKSRRESQYVPWTGHMIGYWGSETQDGGGGFGYEVDHSLKGPDAPRRVRHHPHRHPSSHTSQARPVKSTGHHGAGQTQRFSQGGSAYPPQYDHQQDQGQTVGYESVNWRQIDWEPEERVQSTHSQAASPTTRFVAQTPPGGYPARRHGQVPHYGPKGECIGYFDAVSNGQL